MDLTARQELSDLAGFAVTIVVGASLAFVLHPLSRGRRLVRAALWFWAWGIGSWTGYAVALFIGGSHRVTRVRGSDGWTDWHLDERGVLQLALGVGVLAALFALWLPFVPEEPPPRGTRSGRPRA